MKTAEVLDVQKIRTMSDYDVTCKHCEHLYNGRGDISCPACGNPWWLNDPLRFDRFCTCAGCAVRRRREP